jgi:iron complex outermembrane recepter protein
MSECARFGRWVVALALSVLALGAQCTWSADVVRFDIAAGPARQTLLQFQDDAHVWVLFAYDAVDQTVTHSVTGPLEPAAALAQMLEGTALTFAFGDRVKGRTVVAVDAGRRSSSVRTGPETGRASAGPSAKAVVHHNDVLDEVMVTGTHIRDTEPVGAPPKVYSQEDIEESGASTVVEFLHLMPETFGGGATEDTTLGREAFSNTGFGVGVNLRGLGSEATLILVNGRRPAPSGSSGAFTDVSNIPSIAIQRVEVLTAGASSVYGSDAVGGVVNFITQDSELTSQAQQFSGARTRSRLSTTTDGSMRAQQFGQLVGWSEGNTSTAIGFEYLHRDALNAADRVLAQSDLTGLGGSNFDSSFSNPGNIRDGGLVWAIPRGQSGYALRASDLLAGTVNLNNQHSDAQVLPSQRRFSLYGATRASLSDELTVFWDALLSRRTAVEQTGGATADISVPSSNPFYVNPLGNRDPVTIQYNFLADLGPDTTNAVVQTANLGLGAEVAVGHDWLASTRMSEAIEKQNVSVTNLPDLQALNAALADPNPTTAFNPFGDGSHTNPNTLTAIRGVSRFKMTSTLRAASVTADGPVAELPGGALKVALGMEYRNQSFESSQTQSLLYAPYSSALGRHLWGGFCEVIAPLIEPAQSSVGLRKLTLSVAARRESYSDSDGAITPRWGLSWSPIQRVELGGTWAKSSRPPNLGDLDESRNFNESIGLPDRSVPSGSTTALVLFGTNSQLHAEHATNWTLAARLQREEEQGLSMGLSYFNINFNNRIQALSTTIDVLQNPGYASIVIRNPSPALVDKLCSTSVSVSGSADNCRGVSYGAVVDFRVQNVQTLQTQGFDFDAAYRYPSRFGTFDLSLVGTYMTEFALTSPPGGRLSLLDTLSNPIRLHMRGSLTWRYRGLGVILSGNYANSYWNTEAVPMTRIDSWMTADAQMTWAPGGSSAWLAGTEFQFIVRNVFNRNPPFASNASAGIGYDQENGDLTNRFVTLGIVKRW